MLPARGFALPSVLIGEEGRSMNIRSNEIKQKVYIDTAVDKVHSFFLCVRLCLQPPCVIWNKAPSTRNNELSLSFSFSLFLGLDTAAAGQNDVRRKM